MSSSFDKAESLLRQGSVAAAEQFLNATLQKTPADFSALETLVALKTNQGQWRDAIAVIEKQINRLPPSSVTHCLLGDTLRAAGKMEDAERQYWKAIEIEPTNPVPFPPLANVKKYKPEDQLLSRIEQYMAEGIPEVEASAGFYFAAAKICDDIGEYDKAFAHYEKANRLSNKTFSAASFNNGVEALKETFSKDFFTGRPGFGSQSETPIFVLGMPRSGTTLVEQMIAAHAQAEGVGERPDIPTIASMLGKITGSNHPYPYAANAVDKACAKALGEQYVDSISRSVSDSSLSRIVDKNPLNFLHIGVIAMILPNAKIIHMQRHPVDTCLSCYFQDFVGGLEFTYSLESLAQFYLGYRSLMDYWSELFPGRILNVKYEDITAEPEQQIRKMLDFCGLEWDSGCLDYAASRQPIRTASVWQVRQPLYKSSVARWRKYEKHVQGLTEALTAYI